jgi:hypothetical protein
MQNRTSQEIRVSTKKLNWNNNKQKLKVKKHFSKKNNNAYFLLKIYFKYLDSASKMSWSALPKLHCAKNNLM